MIRNFLHWCMSNAPSMNIIFWAVLGVGTVSVFQLQRELFPEFQMETIQITMSYPGAAPADVEEGICQKIEEAVRSVDGINKINSSASEGVGTISLEIIPSGNNTIKVLNDVQTTIDQIQTFPAFTERPTVKLLTRKRSAVRLGIISENDHKQTIAQLRSLAEQARDELLEKRTISSVNLDSVPDFQIDVEISEQTLRSFGLSLQEVANRIRRENHQMPGGVLRSESQELLLRGNNQRTRGAEIAEIPIISQDDGTVVKLGDLGIVKDGFSDTPFLNRINGKPALSLSVMRTASGDLFAMKKDVSEYLENVQLPSGFSISVLNDSSVPVKQRLELLSRNGLIGMLLVLAVLAFFLEVRLAFWVALGIPFSILVACGVLFWIDQSLNLISTFAFLIALGVVVDDAIVVGENVYTHRQMGKSLWQAAIDGTAEVLPAVTVSVLTTVFAFLPMFFVSGRMGKLIWILPTVIVSMFLASLIECITVLPCHLGHQESHLFRAIRTVFYSVRWLLIPVAWLNRIGTRLMDWAIERIYLPTLTRVLRIPVASFCLAIGVLGISAGLVLSGRVPFVIFATEDSTTVVASISFPDGTPFHITERWVNHIEKSIPATIDSESVTEVVKTVHSSVGNASGGDDGQAGASGSHHGSIEIELEELSDRRFTSQELANKWRVACGQIPGIESLRFYGSDSGPGGTAIQFAITGSADKAEQLEAAAFAIQTKLRMYDGVFDVRDDASPGKWELQYRVKDDAVGMGVRPADLSETIRAAYFGEEVMRLQRGRHEVKLLVRYPEEERSDLSRLEEVRIRTAGNAEQTLGEIAEFKNQRGYSTIRRVAQKRAVTISADVDQARANASKVVADLKDRVLPEILNQYPGVSILWEGQQQQQEESFQSLFLGFAVAIVGMFVLLSFQFRSYLQPGLILSIIPFGVIGAVWGHYMLGRPLTFFSVLGIVALTGVVVNDSIVLVDFINSRIRSGYKTMDAVVEAGRRRFRPVVLTSLTTVAGVFPILLETSRQAQMVIPMATSLCFGLMFATVLVLFLVPVLYSILDSMFGEPRGGSRAKFDAGVH